MDKFYGEIRHIRCDFTERAGCEPVQAHDKKTIERSSTLKRSHKKHRNREEIVANVLEAARNGATKTRIMYISYLSFGQLQRYINHALETKLLDLDAITNRYHTTSKGFEFLQRFEEVNNIENNIVEKRRSLSAILENKDS